MHHEISGLGAALPMRALQRRLSQLKVIGVNAVRTSHNPYAPEFYDLCDRMGFMVMDEFFDAWTGHKQSADFGGTTFNNSGPGRSDRHAEARSQPPEHRPLQHRQRDPRRAHVAARHRDDPHQHLPQHRPDPPGHAGAVPPQGHRLLPGQLPRRAGRVRRQLPDRRGRGGLRADAPPRRRRHRDGTSTSDWSTITGNPQLTGMFLWTGFDYLGEAADMWPTVGASSGIMDRMGTHKSARGCVPAHLELERGAHDDGRDIRVEDRADPRPRDDGHRPE